MAARKGRATQKRVRPGEYVGFRAPTELKEKLEAAAKESARSLSSEAQFRLERSFRDQELVPEIIELSFGARLAGLLLMIGALRAFGPAWKLQHVGYETTGSGLLREMEQYGRALRSAESDWLDDPYAFEQFAKAVNALLQQIRPPDAIAKPPQAAVEDLGGGEVMADELLDHVMRPSTDDLPTDPWEAWLRHARRMLGPNIIERIAAKRGKQQ